MNEQSSGATDATVATAPEEGAVEQKQTSYEDTLLKLATDQGLIGPAKTEVPPSADEVPPAQDEPPTESEETETEPPPVEEGEPEEEKEPEEKPAAKGEPWPESAKQRVAEETDKRKRANERLDRAESELAKAQQERDEARRLLSQASGPMPTPDNPLIDIQEPVVLDRLERVYELLEEVDIDKVNEDGTVTVPAAIGQDGKIVYQNIDPDQARLAQKRADRVLRKDIPNRRKYLTERAQIDAGATEWYPDLKNPDHEFTRTVNQLTGQILNGSAMQSPDIKFWVANAVYGYMKRRDESQANNGNGATSGVKAIVDASKQKRAPTASRTRATVERQSSADLATLNKEFEKNPSPENAEKLIAATLSGSNARRTVQPAAE